MTRFAVFLVILFNFTHLYAASNTINDAYPIADFNTVSRVNINVSEEHWWKFNLKSGEGFTFALTAFLNTSSLDFDFYDKEGNYLAGETAYSRDTNSLSRSVNRNDVYFVRVKSTSTASGYYDFAVYSSWYNQHNKQDTTRSFQSSFNTAAPIQEGTYTAKTMPDGDVLPDYYYFIGTRGDTFVLSLTSMGTTTYLRLYDRFGNRIISEKNIYAGDTETISYRFDRTSVYFIRVDQSNQSQYTLDYNGVTNNADSDSDGVSDAAEYVHNTDPTSSDTDSDDVSDYTELFNGTDPRVAAEYAASVLSSVMGTAKSIPATNTPISAIQNKDGESWWKFTGTQGEYYSVALTPFIDDSSLTLYVRDSNDNNIKSETIYGHETDFLDFSTPTTGNYYIRIKGGSDAAGFYNLAVYESWTNTGTLDSDRDLHFDYNTAKYLQDGLHFQQMSPDGEDIYDYYRFKAKANATISITVDSNSGTKTARLYDSNGNSLVSDNIYNGGVETLSKTVFVEGYYYFYVYGSTGSYYLFSDGIIEDSDFDSIPDDEDRYIDTDSDGIQNAVDNDDDNDNIPDSWETANGLNPYISNSGIDTDGDSFNDYTEYLANTDPTDYLSYPSLDCSPVDGRMTIIGKTYSSGFSFCQAEHSIDTSGTVTVKKNAGAVYRAPTVTLDKGFSVENGGFFKAEATNR